MDAVELYNDYVAKVADLVTNRRLKNQSAKLIAAFTSDCTKYKIPRSKMVRYRIRLQDRINVQQETNAK